MGALVVLGGTTASGKSTLALEVARASGGAIVNADSQQLFRDLPILTARPTARDVESAEHRLYGVLGPDEPPSAGRWLGLVEPVLDALATERRPAIVTGGSGLYLEALLRGLAPVPPVPAVARREVRELAATLAPAELHARLGAVDPVMAERLRPSDPHRVMRALEVIEATGVSLARWQARPRVRIRRPEHVLGIALVPRAETVAGRVERRLASMLERGALREVEELLRRRPDLVDLPVAKVHGARELAAVVSGRLSLAAALPMIAAQVRQYAKRQRTFLRHRLPELVVHEAVGEDAGGIANRLLNDLATPP